MEEALPQFENDTFKCTGGGKRVICSARLLWRDAFLLHIQVPYGLCRRDDWVVKILVQSDPLVGVGV